MTDRQPYRAATPAAAASPTRPAPPRSLGMLDGVAIAAYSPPHPPPFPTSPAIKETEYAR